MTISRIETGRSKGYPVTLERIERALEIVEARRESCIITAGQT